jgi:hypothetical protein
MEKDRLPDTATGGYTERKRKNGSEKVFSIEITIQ